MSELQGRIEGESSIQKKALNKERESFGTSYGHGNWSWEFCQFPERHRSPSSLNKKGHAITETRKSKVCRLGQQAGNSKKS